MTVSKSETEINEPAHRKIDSTGDAVSETSKRTPAMSGKHSREENTKCNEGSNGFPLVQKVTLEEFDQEKLHKKEEKILSPDLSLVGGVKISLCVLVGNTKLTVEELFNLKNNDVLRLDRHSQQDLDLVLDGKVVARGQLVVADDNFAIRIKELSRT